MAAPATVPSDDIHIPDANNETEQEHNHVHTSDVNNEMVAPSEQEPPNPDANNEKEEAPLEQKPSHVHLPDAKNEREVPTEPNHVLMHDIANSEIVVSMEQEPNHVLVHDIANTGIVVSMEQEQHDHVHMHRAKFEMVALEPLPDHVMEQYPNYDNHQMIVSMEPQTMNNEIVHVEQQPNVVPVNTPGQYPNKRRKKKSLVWEHFTIEMYDDNSRRACCKQCNQSFAYSTGNKVAGTSHLKRHVAKGICSVVLRNMEKNRVAGVLKPPSGDKSVADTTTTPTPTPRRRYRTCATPSPYVSFDVDQCRHEISRMIIMHDYPLHIVDHPGFVAFVQTLQPRFEMVSFNTVQGDCVATYLEEKQNIQKVIESVPGRICLTLDMWSSSRSVGYVFLTGYFIDSDWKIHRKLLNVIMEPYPDSDASLSHAVAACLSDWNMDGKLFSVTLNQGNQPLTDTAVDNLRALVSVKNPLVLNGQLILGHCLARSLTTIAQEAFHSLRFTVKKVRGSVKYVKTYENVEEKFLELKSQLQVPTTKILVLDDQSKWDTTYEMLSTASEFKQVFSCLDYKDAPSMEDWMNIETLCTYLKPLFETANLLTVPTVPTTNMFFHEAWKIQLELARRASSTNDDDSSFISNNLTKSMAEIFDIYWKSSCFILAIAVVMDPRFKMKLVEFSFSKIYGKKEGTATYVKVVDEGIHELFQEYVTTTTTYTPDDVSQAHTSTNGLNGRNGLTDFDTYIMETTSQQSKTELDQYLEESLLPRVHEFDVVGWWKLNRMKYPTLSKMARDILSIPVCSVAADAVFDTDTKEMDPYKCSIRPETAEALICAKDWLQTHALSSFVQMEVPI